MTATVDFTGDLTKEVIGAFYEVHSQLRYGFLESAYAGALQVELRRRAIPALREVQLQVRYKDEIVGVYRADFVVDGRLLLELKTQAKVGHHERRQLLHYLRATDSRLGLVLNFGPAATFLRVINSAEVSP